LNHSHLKAIDIRLHQALSLCTSCNTRVLNFLSLPRRPPVPSFVRVSFSSVHLDALTSPSPPSGTPRLPCVVQFSLSGPVDENREHGYSHDFSKERY
jgi:hypothetical protein